MKSDGSYKRTRLTVLRAAKTKGESRFTIGGQVKKVAPKPVTLPKLPWDTKPADDKK